MSESLSEDVVVKALKLERQLDDDLDLTESSADKARVRVRDDMEKWLELMNEPNAREQYREALGELDPKIAETEMLRAINKSFPRVAKELGYKPEMEYQDAQVNDLAA